MRPLLSLATLATCYAILNAAVLDVNNANSGWVAELEEGKFEISEETGMKVSQSRFKPSSLEVSHR